MRLSNELTDVHHASARHVREARVADVGVVLPDDRFRAAAMVVHETIERLLLRGRARTEWLGRAFRSTPRSDRHLADLARTRLDPALRAVASGSRDAADRAGCRAP